MLLLAFAQVAALLSIQALPTIAASLAHRATICNGHAELCSRSYGNMTFVGAHDSYAVGPNLPDNQDYNVTQQLIDGMRLLQVQAHQQPDGVRLCHTNCSLQDGGLAITYLQSVKKWLDGNPNDVLTILIVNIDNLPPTQFQAIYQNASLEALSYSPPKDPMTQMDWPSLGSMIDSDKRLVTFLDNQADSTQVSYLIDEFKNVKETPFDQTNNTAFNCQFNRFNGNPGQMLSLINHYLDKLLFGVPVPDKNNLNITNAVSGPGSVGDEVTTCQALDGHSPNFILVDFYEYGNGSVLQVAANVNGVPYAPTSPIATPSAAAPFGQPTSVSLNRGFPARGMTTQGAILGSVSSVIIGVLATL